MTVVEHRCTLANEAAIQPLVALLAPAVSAGGVITLSGDLGTGKTTLARALLRELGVQGRIRSPTYSLLESYQVADLNIQHLDLYRLVSPEEIDDLGLREHSGPGTLVLIEWPQRGEGALPPVDLEIHLEHRGGEQRGLLLRAHSPWAEKVVELLARSKTC